MRENLPNPIADEQSSAHRPSAWESCGCGRLCCGSCCFAQTPRYRGHGHWRDGWRTTSIRQVENERRCRR